MRGKYRVVVKNKRLHYEFEIKRNITIIKGDSATGKTTLINMIRQFANLGNSSGVDLMCDVPCRTLEGADWKIILRNISGNILFIDEENTFIRSEEFASEIKESDNYFVIITRENLYNLPYSVEEIYGLHSSGKYQNTKQIYQQMYRIYTDTAQIPVEPQTIVVEDSNSGYEFFKSIAEEQKISCRSAGGKTKLYSVLKKSNMDEEICVVADGAAIGAEMEKLYKLSQQYENIKLYLPESFEWIILRSGIITEKEISKILESPEDYIDSREFFSWERYFTRLLVQKTEGTPFKYQKSKLNPVYLHEKNKKQIGNVRVEYLHRIQRVYEKEITRMQEIIDNSHDNKEISNATKRKEKLQKQIKETKDYDAKIAHLALSRIDIDLDDGVKVNYEKVQTVDGKKMQILTKI